MLASCSKSLQIAGIRSPKERVFIRDDRRLDGWKAIANFLGRERTTAIRWANERGLPVHRVPGGRTGTVYALADELDAWLASDRSAAPAPAGPVDPGSSPPSAVGRPYRSARKRRLLAACAAVFALATGALLFLSHRPGRPDPPVSIAAVAAPGASRETEDFARGLNADLARFANATPTLAVFEREPGAAPGTEYAIRTELDRSGGRMVANARVIAVRRGQVVWSRRFEQSGPALAALRERVAANIVDVLRCSFGGLESERAKVQPVDVEQLLAICDGLNDEDGSVAHARARQFTASRPDLALGWALLAMIQGNMAGDGVHDSALRRDALASSKRAQSLAPNAVATWLATAAATGDGPTSPAALPVLDAALHQHPDQPWLLANRSVILFNLGYVRSSVADALAAVRSDPSSLAVRDTAVRRLAAAGRMTEAEELQAENERLWPAHPLVVANRARIAPAGPQNAAAERAAIAENERLFAGAPYTAYLLARLYERRGDHKTALAWLARAPTRNALQQWSLLFWPDMAGLRAEPLFFRKMADLGLLGWWQQRKQWPDFCAEAGKRYECAGEAGRAPTAG